MGLRSAVRSWLLKDNNEENEDWGHQYGWSIPVSSGPYAPESSEGLKAENVLTLSAMWRAFNLLSGLTAMLPAYIKQRQKDGTYVIDEKHRWFDAVYDQPNPYQDSAMFRKFVVSQLFFGGETFWWPRTMGKKREIIALPRHRMNPIRIDENGYVVWAYSAPDGVRYELVAGKDLIVTVGVTLDGLRGCSLLKAASRATKLGKTLELYGQSHFSNSPMMKGILIPKKPVGSKQRATITKSFSKAFSGEKNWHSIPVLPSEMTWESIGINNQDSQFLETKQYTILEFARFTGIPAVLLMHTDKSAVYANASKFFSSFIDYDFAIWLSMIEGSYNKLLSRSERRTFKTEIDRTQLLRGDMETRFKVYKVGREIGVWSPNDILRKEGEPSRVGGDIYAGDVEKTPTATTGSKPEPEKKE